MKITIEEEKLYELIKKALDEVLRDNIEELKIASIPFVDKKEMRKINQIFESPENYKEEEYTETHL